MMEANQKPKYTPYQIAELLGQPAPTAQQAQVIAAPLEPLLVVAGAGSGKTETMAARVVYLVANGFVRPEQVLGLTFTRKAAGELLERVQKRLSQLAAKLDVEFDATNRPTVATYNSFAQSIVQEYGMWVGIEPSVTLLSEASAWQLMHQVVEGFDGVLETERALSTVAKEVLELEGQLAEHLVTPQVLADYIAELSQTITQLPLAPRKRSTPTEVAGLLTSLQLRAQYLELVQRFRQLKQQHNAITFGDQIAYAAQIATRVPQVAQAARNLYRVVLLDEYQDTSHAQIAFLAGLFGGGHPVTAVGDPNQAIYGWRGASASGLARFPQEFHQADGQPARVLPLATAWRNDQAILEVANQVAVPLRENSTQIEVSPLQLSPKAGQGAISALVLNTAEEEANAVADWIAERWFAGSATTPSEPPTSDKAEQHITAAVLCRTRKQFGLISKALGERGVPYEVVGLGGLLDTPAVTDLLAMLQVAADPARGDWLLRLLTGPRVNLGAADLHALSSWAATQAQQKLNKPKTEQSRIADEAENRSLIDAVNELPPPSYRPRDGRNLSSAARIRLTRLAQEIRNVRRSSYLSIPEICLVAERELDLDIEVAVAKELGGYQNGRADLDAFRQVAANYARSTQHPTLLGFLEWLEAAREREGGLDQPLAAVNQKAVQLITVHAAKGLEWDIVAIPGLVEGNFPTGRKSAAGRQDSAWLTDNGSLPYPLRGDRADLPAISWPQTDQNDVAARITQFKLDSGAHELASERRLAYVAFTRAKHQMLLTAYWWGSQIRPRELSVFLTELVEAELISDGNWAEQPEPDAKNPLLAQAEVAVWPPPISPLGQRINSTKLLVEQATAHPTLGIQGTDDLARLARTLLAEQAGQVPQEVPFPKQLSASALVRLSSSREEFAEQLRRPVPLRPTPQAQVGTQFHNWAQQFFGGVSYLFEDDEMDDSEELQTAEEQQLAELKEAFLRSHWSRRTPLSTEQEVHHLIAGVPIISRIDAVFADPEQPEVDLVIDWKTGRPGRTETERRHREVQLAVYRLAWSRLSGKPLDKVTAAFHYISSDQTVRPTALLSEAELEELVMGSAS